MQIVVLGPSSACGNVAAVRDVLVLPIREGKVGYQRETNMEHAVSALGAAGVWCPQASRAVGRNQRRNGFRLYRHILHPKGRSAYPAVSVGLRVGRPGRNGRRRRPGRVRTRG